MSKLSSLSPMICLLLLFGGIGLMDDQEERFHPQREADIRAELERFPEQLGPGGRWVAVREVPIPTNQSRMLGLVGFVSRQYQRLGVSPPLRANIFVAHAQDARSMAGHHPPNCYPASGWSLASDSQRDLECLGPGGIALPFRLYRFSLGLDERTPLWVGNGFLMPEFGAARTLEETERVSGRAETSRLGLLQYQVLIEGGVPSDVVAQYLCELLSTFPKELHDVVVLSESQS